MKSWVDTINNQAVSLSNSSAVYTADDAGASADLAGYNSCELEFTVGVSGDTLSGSVYANLEVQHSDDDSTFAAVANADLTTSVTSDNVGTIAKVDAAAEDDAVFRARYIGKKRYVKCVLNLVGTHTNGIPVSSVIRRSAKNNNPVA